MSGIIELRQRIRGIHTLDEVVHAMRSIAGVRLRQAQHAFAGLTAYEDAIAAAFDLALAFWPDAGRHFAERASRGPQALVVVGSEHGFVGGYNEHLLLEARHLLAPGDQLYVVGARVARLAQRQGLALAGVHAMPVRAAHATVTALGLAETLWPAYRAGQVTRLAILHSLAPSGDVPHPVCVALAPLTGRSLQPRAPLPPLTQVPPEHLVGQLAGELLIARLIHALVEAVQAENQLRLRAMERAKRNVESRLADLRLAECRLAQELTTNEILELVNATG
jgi:F-type H+-transporting ATPase subunit gamma